MISQLVVVLTGLMIMGNMTGLYVTSWWSIFGMFVGWMFLGAFIQYAIEVAATKKEKEAEEIVESIKAAAAEMAKETEETNKKDLH